MHGRPKRKGHRVIVVLIADPRTGQANLSFEGGPPESVHELLYAMTDNLGKQLGKPPLPKPSGIVTAPASAVPDIKQRIEQFKQQGPQP